MNTRTQWTCKSCGKQKDDRLIVEWGICGECFHILPGGGVDD